MSRSSILAPHRLVLVGVVLALAVMAILFLRGPNFLQRWYYPLPEEYIETIAESAERHQVNPYLIAAVIESESNWRAKTASEAGAVGLMQVMPSTAEEMRREGMVDSATVSGSDLSDPSANIEYGTAYFRFLVERYHEIETALAAYNAGISNVDEWVEVDGDIREEIEFPETRHYVLRVIRARDAYEELYPDVFPAWEGDR